MRLGRERISLAFATVIGEEDVQQDEKRAKSEDDEEREEEKRLQRSRSLGPSGGDLVKGK